jgi:DinB superfamily
VDATIAAAAAIFEDSVGQLREAIRAASPETLNARPAGDDTNPIAVLAMHAMLSTRMWLACAIGAPIPVRDRPAEFRARAAGADELLADVDAVAEECRAILGSDARFDPAAARDEPSMAPGHVGSGERVTAAWSLLHALEHLGEHAGQASLTRQTIERCSR